MSRNKQSWYNRLPILVILVALIAAMGTSMSPSSSHESLPEVAEPQISDAVSDTELEDLRAVARQMGISLQAAIDRYAWNDNFALAVAKIRESVPTAFTGAEITDAGHAWVAFAGSTPETARDIINTFASSNSGVSVEVRTNLGFTAAELEGAIEVVHFVLLEAPEVRDASTSFDFATRRMTTLVVLADTDSDSVLDALRDRATNHLTDSGGDILSSIAISLLRSDRQFISGSESNSEHLGGEALSTCTSGFGTVSSSGIRGISTAGHCQDSQTDDGSDLTYQTEHIGAEGDFQWHTGSEQEDDEFYAGDDSSTETERRDVSSVGSPIVGQSLCRNGKTSYKNCQEVRKLDVCSGDVCHLVQMGEHLSADGDSGGPVYWVNTAYGIHKGYMYDPVWPFSREVFSRADRMGYALAGIVIATV